MKHLLLLIEVLLFAFGSSAKLAPIVQLTAGKVVGITQEVDNATVHLYQGIRYGTDSFAFRVHASTKLSFLPHLQPMLVDLPPQGECPLGAECTRQ